MTRLISFLFLFLCNVGLLAQTTQQSLMVTRIYGITSSWAGECAAGVVSNVSPVSRRNNNHHAYVTGTGSWTLALQYSDVSCSGPWSSFGSAASIDQTTSPPIAIGVGYHPYVKIVITGNATATYIADKDFYSFGAASGTSFPISIGQGGLGSTTTAGARAALSLPLNPVDYQFPAQIIAATVYNGAKRTITMNSCPIGVNGADTNHYLYITDLVGTSEAFLIAGGTCTSGAASGTLIASSLTYDHLATSNWTVSSATGGVQEAVCGLPSSGGEVTIVAATTLYANVASCGKTNFGVEKSAGVVITGAYTVIGESYVSAANLERYASPYVGAAVDKGGAVYNVKAYGATGNGTTDDTAAIQAAITAAGVVGGGTVLVPPGTYKISATLTIPGGMATGKLSMYGAHLVAASGFTGPMIQGAANLTSFTMQGGKIDANGQAGITTMVTFSRPESSIRNMIDGVTFSGIVTNATALNMDGCEDSVVQNSQFIDYSGSVPLIDVAWHVLGGNIRWIGNTGFNMMLLEYQVATVEHSTLGGVVCDGQCGFFKMSGGYQYSVSYNAGGGAANGMFFTGAATAFGPITIEGSYLINNLNGSVMFLGRYVGTVNLIGNCLYAGGTPPGTLVSTATVTYGGWRPTFILNGNMTALGFTNGTPGAGITISDIGTVTPIWNVDSMTVDGVLQVGASAGAGNAVAGDLQTSRDVSNTSSAHYFGQTGSLYFNANTFAFSHPVGTTVATGTAPLVVASTTLNTNLNADLLDGLHATGLLASTAPKGTGTAVTITSGFGTSPSIAGVDAAFRVTLGTPVGTSGIVALKQTWATAPVIVCNDETTNATVRATPTTTQVTLTQLSGTWVAGDKLSCTAIGY